MPLLPLLGQEPQNKFPDVLPNPPRLFWETSPDESFECGYVDDLEVEQLEDGYEFGLQTKRYVFEQEKAVFLRLFRYIIHRIIIHTAFGSDS